MNRILIVEDSPTQAEQLRFSLESEGFDAEVACDAEQALELISTQRFDLVVSDIVMPGASGYDLCRQLKAAEGTRDIPIVLLSSLHDPMTIIEALECGADNFLTKPYDPEHLVSRITTALSNKKIRGGGSLKIGVEVMFLGKRLSITSDKEQILDLLMSTFEDIVRTNAELEVSKTQLATAKDELERYAKELELRVEERTAELQDRQRQLSEAQKIAQIGDWYLNLRTEKIRWSDQMFRLFGTDPREFEPMLSSVMGFLDPGDRDQMNAALAQATAKQRSFEIEARMTDATGGARHLWITGHPEFDPAGKVTALFGVAQDITERKRIEAQVLKVEEQLYRAQKMEAIGQLTGGISHDFNNLLAIIIGNLDVAREQISEGDIAEALDEALEAALRGADLNQRLLAFAGRQSLEPKLTDVNQLIASTNKLLGRVLGEQIDVQLSLADQLRPVLIDPAQLESAITNLALNARDAMSEGGQLTIKTYERELAEDEIHEEFEAGAGEYLVVEVGDTGSGMPQDVVARACEPFFTTKEVGKGTGLGLSMVLGFMKQSAGQVQIRSEVGGGTVVQLLLPIARMNEYELEREEAASLKLGTAAGEVVLVVEDNQPLRRLLIAQLRTLGYSPLEAEAGGPALEILATGRRVDLLMTDVVMPGGIDGQQLAREAMRLRPNIRVLLTSGYPEADPRSQSSFNSEQPLLRKPYRKAALAQALQDALARS